MDETNIETQEVNNSGENKSNQKMMVAFGIAGLLIVGAVAIFAMKGSGSPSVKSPEPTTSSMTDITPGDTSMAIGDKEVEGTATSSTGVESKAQVINMEAGSFYYKPNVLTVKKGQKVQIVFNSVDMMHNLNIDELNVHSTSVKSGSTETIEFTPTKAGIFEYYCSIGQHRKMGQVGKITVTE